MNHDKIDGEHEGEAGMTELSRKLNSMGTTLDGDGVGYSLDEWLRFCDDAKILERVAKAAAFIRENRFLGAWPDVVELEKALDEARKAGLL